MCHGRLFEESEIKLSSSVTGEPSRIESSRTRGKSTARLSAIFPRSTTMPTLQLMPGRWRQMSDESFPEQVQRIVVDNAFAFVLGWLLGAGHVLSLFSDLAGAFS